MIKGDGFSSLHHQRQDEAYDLFRVEQLIDFSLERRKDGGEGGRFHAYCSKLCKVSKVDDFLFMPWIFTLLSQARLSIGLAHLAFLSRFSHIKLILRLKQVLILNGLDPNFLSIFILHIPMGRSYQTTSRRIFGSCHVAKLKPFISSLAFSV